MKNVAQLIKTLALCLALVMMTGGAKGATKTAITGNWNTSGTWSPSGVPVSSDDIIIPDGVTVTMNNANYSFTSSYKITINGTGKITFSRNNTNTLNINGTIIFNGTSGNAITSLSTGGSTHSSFILGSSATLITANQNGITGTNASIQAGLSQYIVTLPENANYEFNGGTQATTGLPVTVNNLTLSGSGEKTISAATTVNGNLTISSGSKLVIAAAGQVTVTGTLTNNNTTGVGLSILSDATKTGSLFVKGTASGSVIATVKRTMTAAQWHLIASPLSGEPISDFLTANSSTLSYYVDRSVTPNVTYSAIRDYNASTNKWKEFFTSATTGSIGLGIGYSIRVQNKIPQEITFTGSLNVANVDYTVVPDKWNCIGNPFTSALNISGSGTTFLSFNDNKLPLGFKCVYVYDPAGNGSYFPINNSSTIKSVQMGQAFMVLSSIGEYTVSVTKDMQVPDVALALKSTDDIWPTINLMVTGDSVSSTTVIAFHDGMTNGLDPSYDAGLLKAGGPMELYTRLVDDYGIPFDIQALPSDAYDQLIIPVGVDYTRGGTVSFSAKGMYLPASCRPILEDRLLGIMTDLSDTTYTTDLTAHAAETGRFYLHTSYASTRAVSHDKALGLSAWAVGNHEININGQINNGATASIFDVQGRLIDTYVLREGRSNRISLPSVNPGIYLLQVRDAQTLQVVKIIVCK